MQETLNVPLRSTSYIGIFIVRIIWKLMHFEIFAVKIFNLALYKIWKFKKPKWHIWGISIFILSMNWAVHVNTVIHSAWMFSFFNFGTHHVLMALMNYLEIMGIRAAFWSWNLCKKGTPTLYFTQILETTKCKIFWSVEERSPKSTNAAVPKVIIPRF